MLKSVSFQRYLRDIVSDLMSDGFMEAKGVYVALLIVCIA